MDGDGLRVVTCHSSIKGGVLIVSIQFYEARRLNATSSLSENEIIQIHNDFEKGYDHRILRSILEIYVEVDVKI